MVFVIRKSPHFEVFVDLNNTFYVTLEDENKFPGEKDVYFRAHKTLGHYCGVGGFFSSRTLAMVSIAEYCDVNGISSYTILVK